LKFKRISSGQVIDTDYKEDNRTNPIFNAEFQSKEGSTLSRNLLLGHTFTNTNVLKISMAAGYTIDQQNLYLTDNNQLNSSYKANWKGLRIASETKVSLSKLLSLSCKINYNQLNYKAQANWNLIDDFQHPVSYTHIAKGFSTNTSLGLAYHLKKSLDLFIDSEYSAWRTGKGIDNVFLVSGKTQTTQFNGARINGIAVLTGITYSFK
jgi:hypothetical protein